MKKFWKVLLCSLGLCLCLVGCATVPDIKNNEGGIVYNGSAAAMVGDYLYFANSYIANTAIGNSDESYVDNAKKSYLARVNTKNLTAPSKDHSVNGVEKVEEELAGHTNTKIFALGEYVYYSTPKREKTSSGDGSEFQFDRTTFYRSKLNGDNKTKMFTSSNVVSKVEVVSHSGRNFLLILDGGNLVKIELNGDPKAETIASDVTSAALPQTYEKNRVGSNQNWNGYVYVAKNKKVDGFDAIGGTSVKRISITSGKSEEIFWQSGKTVKFLDREDDVLFFTYNETSKTEVYICDLTGKTDKNAFVDNMKRFHSASEISNIQKIASKERTLGYFYSVSNSYVYAEKTNEGFNKTIVTLKNGEENLADFDIMFTSGRDVFLRTSTGLYYADVANTNSGNAACNTIVTMTAILDANLYAFDGTYVYYYAQLEKLKDKDGNDIALSDTRNYLYRAKVYNDKTDDYQLLGACSR